MTAPLWQVSESDGVVIAAHDNPPMNYLTANGVRELSGLIDAWRTRQVRAVVLTSAQPGRFIIHYSVEELLASQADRERLLRSGRFRRDAFREIVHRLNDLEKPVIAAMNGDTMGGGFEISLACDIRIGERGDYRYGLPEVRLGIIPGLAELLPRLLRAGVREVSANGVLGDPAGASAAEGRALLDRVVGELVELVDAWEERAAPSARPKPARRR